MAYRPSRRAIISTAVIATLLGAFILLLPEIIRRVAVSRLQDVFSVPVAIDDIDINLFTGRAAVENLVIGETPARRILSVPVMTLGFSRSALLTGRINLQRVSLQDPRLVVERTAADTYNITEAVRLPENMKGSEG